MANSGTAAVTLKLNDKALTLTLDRERTPCTTNSFVSLVSQKYFDGTSCHRLADSGIFVLQCGDPTATGTGGPGYEFADELTGEETYPGRNPCHGQRRTRAPTVRSSSSCSRTPS